MWWTNWTNKENKEGLTDGEEMTSSSGVRWGGEGIEQKHKRTHGHGQQCGDSCGEWVIRGLKGNGKIQ